MWTNIPPITFSTCSGEKRREVREKEEGREREREGEGREGGKKSKGEGRVMDIRKKGKKKGRAGGRYIIVRAQ